MNRTERQKHSGFTLIELLVVIAIISLLVSILFPSLQKARDLASTSTCLISVGMLSKGNQMAMAAREGKFIKYRGSTWPSDDRLGPYIDGSVQEVPGGTSGTRKVMRSEYLMCPATESQNDIETLAPGTGADTYHGSAEKTWRYCGSYGQRSEGSYGMNGYAIGTWTDSGENNDYGAPSGNASTCYKTDDRIKKAWPNTMGNVKRPNKMPVFLDSVWIDGWTSYKDDDPGADDPSGYIGLNGQDHGSNHMLRFALDRHRGQMQNVAYLGGSAETIHVSELWDLEWNPVFKP